METIAYTKNGLDVVVFYRKPSKSWGVQIRDYTDPHYAKIYNRPSYIIDIFEVFTNKEEALHFAVEYTNKHIFVYWGGANMISKAKMIKMMIAHGMSATDFIDFYKQYGNKDSYKIKDLRNFLGY